MTPAVPEHFRTLKFHSCLAHRGLFFHIQGYVVATSQDALPQVLWRRHLDTNVSKPPI